MSLNQHHPLTKETLAKMIASGDLKIRLASTSTKELGTTIAFLGAVAHKSHGKKMPLSLQEVERKLAVAEALRKLAVVEGARVKGANFDRAGAAQEQRKERAAIVRSLCEVRDAAQSWLEIDGQPTGAFGVIGFPNGVATVDDTLRLEQALRGAGPALDRAPVEEWLKIVANARDALAAPAQATTSARLAVDAHGAAEVLVMEVIKALRIAHWNDAEVRRQLKLRGGSKHKQPPAANAPPATPTTTETTKLAIA
jgi:hypothetical protein